MEEKLYCIGRWVTNTNNKQKNVLFTFDII